MKTLGVALIGAGMAGRGHMKAFSLLHDCVKVSSVVDVRREAAEHVARETGVRDVFADYREALRSDETEAVDICVPNTFHEEIAVAAAEAGKHILCEKPIARTLQEADRMIDAARRCSAKLMMAHNWLYFPSTIFVKRLVEEGRLGRVFHVRSRIETWRPPLEWRRSRDSLGGGCLINDGVHQFYTLRWFLGDYQGVFGLLGNCAQKEMEGEDTATVLVRFRNGAFGEVTVTWACALPPTPSPTPSVELRGSAGTIISWPWKHAARLYIRGVRSDDLNGWLEPTIPPAASTPDPWVASIRDEILDFAQCISKDEEPPVTGLDGRAALEVVLAAYESAQTGRWTELP